MTLQQLRYIIAIAECGSITSAAKQLLVAQPSVSKAVTDLEAEMGITIFYRNNRGVFVSDEGSKFLPMPVKSSNKPIYWNNNTPKKK